MVNTYFGYENSFLKREQKLSKCVNTYVLNEVKKKLLLLEKKKSTPLCDMNTGRIRCAPSNIAAVIVRRGITSLTLIGVLVTCLQPLNKSKT